MAVGDTTVNLNNPLAKKGAVFDGVDDYVSVPHNTEFLGINLTEGFTISAWVYPKSLGEANYGVISDKSSDSTVANGFKFGMRNNPTIGLTINAGGAISAAANATPYNTWTHVLVKVDSASLISIYINNVISGTPGTSGSIADITDTGNLIIGNKATATGGAFDGLISELKFYNKPLNSNERTKLYNGLNVTDGLVSQWKLDKDYTDSVGDNDGTNNGSYLSSVDDQVASDVSSARVTANDIIKVFPINNKIMNVNIEEA